MTSNYVTKGLKRSALTVALGLCFAGGVQAQSSVGSIFGQAQANGTITITNSATGTSRQVSSGADGRFTFTQLPPGQYKVESNGVTRIIDVRVGSGTPVDFVGNGASLDTVTVVGSSYNPNAIDVSTVQSSTVFTAEEIERIPVGRNVQSVALLAPSVVANSSYSSNAPSFGGSASSENAYYINGYSVTNPLTNIGFSTLPFDAIDQMEVLTGGYGAQYGRSTGGVISVTTKRGTNDWKFGGAVFYTPKSLRSDYRDYYYPDTGHWNTLVNPGDQATDGKLQRRRADNTLDSIQYGVYASGPIVKDHLFFYAAADWSKSESRAINASMPGAYYTSNPSAMTPVRNGWYENDSTSPRWLAKIDWQINDNHSLEFTGIQDKTEQDTYLSFYDFNTWSHNNTQTGGGHYEDGGRMYIGRYIGHFTDNLSLSVVYGKQDIDHTYSLFGYDPSCPRLSGNLTNVRPGITPSQGCQTQASVAPANQFEDTKGGRVDLDWTIGDHSLRFGYDATEAHTLSGTEYAGGYVWVFSRTSNYNNPIDAAHGVGAPGAASGVPGSTSTTGYYVRRQYFTNSADVITKQKAYYIEDRWQITDNFMLSLGIRNENFTNYNGDHAVYVEQKNQWAPRLGFSWDVLGDSTLKVFGNAGRYHLALPNNVAARAAAQSLYTQEYFNYTGVDPVTGAPTGLTVIPADASLGYTCAPNVISANLECGNARDPRVVAAKDLEPHYQDEYIIGFQHQYSQNVNWGMRAHWRALKSAIDDTCTPVLNGECFIFNPGIGNTFYQDDGSGNLVPVYYSAEQLDFPKLKRKYWALDTYIEHVGEKWFGRFEYSFSRNYGNTEGQLHSDVDTGDGGQADVSVTQDWDLPTLMEGAYGLLPNHRAHQIKAYGSYKLTPEVSVGASAIITSGRPLSCTSFYPDPNATAYNGAYYHWCGLPPSSANPGGVDYAYTPRGTSGYTPWTRQINLNAQYRPLWADEKLTFQVDILNVMNEQEPQFKNMRFASDRVTYSRTFGQDLSYTAPRSVRFTVRYDY